MLSTGNDIVSLEEINSSRTNSKQFYSKILSAAEVSLFEQFVPSAIPFEKYVWLLWSIKEAAYKFLKRIEPALVFTPVNFEVRQLEIPEDYLIGKFDTNEIVETGFSNFLALKSMLKVGDYKVYVSSVIYPEFITSIANDDEHFDAMYWGVKMIGFSDHVVQSEEVRTFLYKRASIITGRNELVINKDSNGVPLLFDGEEELAIPVSLAHHGDYVGYSFKY
jgi:phosphopantetheinyl transferase (holo-ACP synthase)